jgi:dephospho-CoA kinase
VSRLILAVTGNIASGKSAVARMFHEKGCALIDADKVAHELYAAHPALVRQVAQEFGTPPRSPRSTASCTPTWWWPCASACSRPCG